jgi:hypothetical protein
MIASIEERVRVQPPEHAGQERHAVAQREEAHVEHHVPHPVEEEDHPHQEEDVVVAGEHVLRAEIHERPDRRAAVRQEERGVVLGDAVRRERLDGREQDQAGRHERGNEMEEARGHGFPHEGQRHTSCTLPSRGRNLKSTARDVR